MPHPVDNHRVADGRPLRQDVETLSTEEQSFSSGLVLTEFRDPNGNWRTEAFGSVQAAIDAVPDYNNCSVGHVRIGSNGNDKGDDLNQDAWIERVEIEEENQFIVEGWGANTKIVSDSDESTIHIDPDADGGDDTDDVWLKDLWVDNVGNGDAIESFSHETHIRGLNVDRAGGAAVRLANSTKRHTVGDFEIKAGSPGILLDPATQSQIFDGIIHDEVGGHINKGIDLGGGNRNMVSNTFVWLTKDGNGDEAAFGIGGLGDYTKLIGVDVRGKESTSTVQIDRGIDAAASTGSLIVGQAVQCNTSLRLDKAVDCVAYGYFPNGVSTDADTTRCVVNGRSWNNGNPASSGGWNGYAERAAMLEATIVDTSGSSPLPRYSAQADGNGGYEWVEESITLA